MVVNLRIVLSSLSLLSAAVSPPVAQAQSDAFPERPIRLVVPFAAGGGVDVFARLLADQLKQQRNYTFVVENRAGANGTIGGLSVRNAEQTDIRGCFPPARMSWRDTS